MYEDTIVALATPPGTGALAIVRLSGSESIEIVSGCVRSATPVAEVASRRCILGTVTDEDQILDQVVVTVFRAPRSYTGEDLVEISCHGGPYVSSRLVHLLQKRGARPARAGEFTLRAYLNGKLDLAQAEAVAALIEARSAAGARAAMRILAGGLRDVLQGVLEELTRLLGELEVVLDIEDEGSPDVLAADPPEASGLSRSRRIGGLHAQLQELARGSRAGRWLEEGVHIALVGRPNAGKSSLFNAFLSRDRAIVSPEPGTTRDSLEGWVEWDGLPIVLLDTAGVQAPRSALDEEGQKRTRQAVASAAWVVLVVDASREGPGDLAEQLAALRALATPVPNEPEHTETQYEPNIVVALHKWDLGPREEWTRPGTASVERGLVPVRSSVIGAPGTTDLRGTLLDRLRGGRDDPRETLLVGDRQRGLIERAAAALDRARSEEEAGAGDEIVAHELRAAMDALGELLGHKAGRLLLDEIFSRFCIGK